MSNITTTNNETWTDDDAADLAYLVFRRWGRDLAAAAVAWRRLHQNSCPDADFEKLATRGAHRRAASDAVCLQESPDKKALWLLDAQTRLPVGSRVRIARSDETAYVGQVGEVVGYDTGDNGEWPGVRVRLDSGTVDVFYSDGIPGEDEVVLV